MSDNLNARHDGPIPPHELAAARHGPYAAHILAAGADAALMAHKAREWAAHLKLALGNGDRTMFKKALRRCRFHARMWRRYRDTVRAFQAKRRQIERESVLLQDAFARGHFKQAG